MDEASETRAAVEGYFQAWTTRRPEEAFAFLAPDLKFSGPTASYESADEFRPALDGFAAMTRSARIVELVVSGSQAALLYDCDLPSPVGTLRIASFFTVRDRRIARYDTRFDATELRKLLSRTT
ncbi:MAG TPA: nuclear transport factor 2 family protein [Candidatus Dormibacteraeota bacterium]|nr:nuclear transport factor 2 family protein [Candidatus Dormibacteraeota bacterium]